MSNCVLPRKGLLIFLLFFSLLLPCNLIAGTIGYYVLGQPSNTSPEASITGAGHTATQLTGLSSGDLSGVDVLWVLNPSNSGYDAEVTSNLAAIDSFVANGGALMFHDRRVTEAATIIPGASAVTFTRATSANIEFGAGATGTIISGPGGTVTTTSLDNLGSSTHGYAIASTLPAGSVIVFNNGDATEAVDFYYSLGNGDVYYSAIPVDAFLGGNPSVDTYTTNLSAFIFELIGPSGSPAQFQHIAMADTARRDATALHNLLNRPLEGIFLDIGSYKVDRGRGDKEQSFDSTSNVIMIGYGHGFTDNFFSGASFSFHDANTDSTFDSSLESEFKSYSLKVFGRYNFPISQKNYGFWVEAIGGYSFLEDVDLNRGTNVGDTNGSQYDITARVGADVAIGNVLNITSGVGIEHINTSLDGYQENGDGGMSYKDFDANVTYAIFSFDISPNPYAEGDLYIQPTLFLEYRQRISQSNDDINVSLVSDPTSMSTMELYEYDDNIGQIGGQIHTKYKDLSIALQASYFFGGDDLNGGEVGLTFSLPLY